MIARRAGLLLPSRARAPQGAVEIDWSDPLTQGLIAYFCPRPAGGTTLVNLVRNRGVVSNLTFGAGGAAPSWAMRNLGPSVEFAAASSQRALGTISGGPAIQVGCTVAAEGACVGTTAADQFLFFVRASTGTNPGLGVGFSSSGAPQLVVTGNNGVGTVAAGAAALGSPVRLIGWSDTNSGVVWRDGVRYEGTHGANMGGGPNLATQSAVGSLTGGGSRYLDGHFFRGAIWARVLTDAEMQRWTTDSLAMLRLPYRGPRKAASGGGGTTVSLTAAGVPWTGRALAINARDAVALSPAAAPWTGRAVTLKEDVNVLLQAAGVPWSARDLAINAVEAITLTAAAAVWTGLDVSVSAGETIQLSSAAAPWTGLSLKLNAEQRVDLAAAAVPWTGRELLTNAEQTIALTVASALWSGRSIQANEVIGLGAAAVTWTGLDVDAIGSEVISLTARGVTWTGRNITVRIVAPPRFFRDVLRNVFGSVLRNPLDRDDN